VERLVKILLAELTQNFCQIVCCGELDTEPDAELSLEAQRSLPALPSEIRHAVDRLDCFAEKFPGTCSIQHRELTQQRNQRKRSIRCVRIEASRFRQCFLQQLPCFCGIRLQFQA